MDMDRSADVTLEQQAAVGSFSIAEALLHILPSPAVAQVDAAPADAT